MNTERCNPDYGQLTLAPAKRFYGDHPDSINDPLKAQAAADVAEQIRRSLDTGRPIRARAI